LLSEKLRNIPYEKIIKVKIQKYILIWKVTILAGRCTILNSKNKAFGLERFFPARKKCMTPRKNNILPQKKYMTPRKYTILPQKFLMSEKSVFSLVRKKTTLDRK